MHPHPLLRRAVLASLAAFLTGCALLSPAEDPTRHFVLKGLRTSRLASRPELVVLVGPVTIPSYLDRTQIVTAGAHNDLELAEFHVWAEDLDKAVGRVVAENLSHLLDSPGIAPYPAVDPPEHDFKVVIVIRRFEMGPDGLVRLEASYILTAPRQSNLPPRTLSRTVTARVADPASHSAIADAMSRTLSDLSRSIGRSVLALDDQRRQAEREKRAREVSVEPRE